MNEQNEFIALVAEMRKMQIEFFTTHSSEALRKSKKLEKEVDNYIASLKQPSLF